MKNYLLLIIMLFSFSAFSQSNKNKNFVIIGKSSSIKNGVIWLNTYYNDEVHQDSAIIKEGKFKFSTNIPYYCSANLYIKGTKNNFLQFYAEPVQMLITGVGVQLSDWKISNSTLNADNQIYKAFMKPSTDKYDLFYKAYDYADSSKNKPMLDSLDIAEHTLIAEQKKLVSEFVTTHSNSKICPFAILNTFSYSSEANEVEPLYNALSPSLKEDAQTKKVKHMLDVYKTIAVGQIAPNITQNDTLGKSLSLTSFKGKYILIDFWASWCKPCRAENPNIVMAYQKFKTRGFDIFAVSYDLNKAKWTKAIVKDSLAWNQVSELNGWKNSTCDLYYIHGIPSNLLIDKEGRIIAKNLFGDKLTAKLAELMPLD